MNTLKTQKKIAKLLESIGRERNQSPSINQMTMVMLVYRGHADSIADLADKMDKPYASARKLSHSLREGAPRNVPALSSLEPSRSMTGIRVESLKIGWY